MPRGARASTIQRVNFELEVSHGQPTHVSAAGDTRRALAARADRRRGRHSRRRRLGRGPRRPGTSPSTSARPPSRCPQTAADVVAVVGFAARDGLRVAPQGTGHNAAALGALDDAILLRTRAHARRRRSTPARAIARVEAGALWVDVAARRAPSTASPRWPAPRPTSASSATRSAAASAGSAASTASPPNSVTAIELVTADGAHRARRRATTTPTCSGRCAAAAAASASSPRSSSSCYPITEVYAGVMLWSRASARARCCTRGASGPRRVPDEVTSVGRHAAAPAAPGDPRAAARPVVRRRRGDLPRRRGRRRRAARAAARARPGDGHVRDDPADGAGHLHMDPAGPVPGIGDGVHARRRSTAEAIDAFVAAGPGSARRCSRSRSATSAARSAAPGARARCARRVRRAVRALRRRHHADAGARRGGAREQATLMREALAPWESSADVPELRRVEAQREDARSTRPRITGSAASRRRYDPGNVIRSNHELEPDPGHC